MLGPEESQLKVKEKESGFNASCSEESKLKVEEEDNLKEALVHETGSLLYDTFNMSKLISQKTHEKVLELGENSLREFLGNLRKKFVENNKENSRVANNLDAFFDTLATTTHFPFTKQQVSNYISRCLSLNKSQGDVETRAKKMYDLISNFLRNILVQTEKVSKKYAGDFNQDILSK